MWYKGQKIEGHFDYVHKQTGDAAVLTVFANIIEQTEESVTVERYTNYGRHQLPTVVKPLWEFQKDYRLITADEKRRVTERFRYER